MNTIRCSLLRIWTVAPVSAVNSCAPTFGRGRQRRRLLSNIEKSTISWSAAGKPSSASRTGVAICPAVACSPVEGKIMRGQHSDIVLRRRRRTVSLSTRPLESLRLSGSFFFFIGLKPNCKANASRATKQQQKTERELSQNQGNRWL